MRREALTNLVALDSLEKYKDDLIIFLFFLWLKFGPPPPLSSRLGIVLSCLASSLAVRLELRSSPALEELTNNAHSLGLGLDSKTCNAQLLNYSLLKLSQILELLNYSLFKKKLKKTNY